MNLKKSVQAALTCLGVGLLLLSLGCQEEPTKPELTTQISGILIKSGQPVVGTVVSLYNDENYTLIDTTITDTSGYYHFSDVAYGRLQVKRSSGAPGEFSYVRHIFTLNADTPNVVVPTMDVSTHGLRLLSPAEGDSVPTPDAFNPLDFVWSSYQGVIEWNNARLYNADDSLVWSSDKNLDTLVTFNGIMNEGGFSGNPAQPGSHRWRVKLKFLSSCKAATDKWGVIFR